MYDYKRSKEEHEQFMSQEYSCWPIDKKIEYWDSKLLFQDKIQSQVTEGIGNIGIYIIKKTGMSFLEKYCERFNIEISIGRKLFELKAFEKD